MVQKIFASSELAGCACDQGSNIYSKNDDQGRDSFETFYLLVTDNTILYNILQLLENYWKLFLPDLSPSSSVRKVLFQAFFTAIALKFVLYIRILNINMNINVNFLPSIFIEYTFSVIANYWKTIGNTSYPQL